MNPKERFSKTAYDYARSRPSYPKEVLDFLKDRNLLNQADRVADIGSGTGLLAELFLSNGNFVFCVEPNPEMRDAGEKYLRSRGYSNFQIVNASAEETALPDHSVEIAAAGQAFHWFDRKKSRLEFRRILRGKNLAVLVWNIRDENASAFDRAYEDLLSRFGADYGRIKNMARANHAGEFFHPGRAERAVFRNRQSFDLRGLEGRLLSSSFVPREGMAGHDEMMREIGKIFETFQENGRIGMNYETRVYCGALA